MRRSWWSLRCCLSLLNFVCVSSDLKVPREDIPPEQQLLVAAIKNEPSCEKLVEKTKQLDCLYQHIYGGNVVPKKQKTDTALEKYGEVLPSGLNLILSDYGLLGLRGGPDDTFFDLGSGLGKLVIQAFLAEGFGLSVGIELVHDRHDAGLKALRKLSVLLGADTAEQGNVAALNFEGRVAELRDGSMLDEDLSAATVVFTCSQTFPKEVMQALTEKLRMELEVGTVILSQSELLEPHEELALMARRFVFTSYSPIVPFNVYIKVPKIPFPPLADSLRSQWVMEVVSALKVEFDRVRHEAALVGEDELLKAFTSSSASSVVRVRRVLRAFGSASVADDDICGCKRGWMMTSEPKPFTLSFADFVTMASYGVYEGSSRVIDLIFVEVFPELRLVLDDKVTMVPDLERQEEVNQSHVVPPPMQELQCIRNSLRETALHLASDHNNASLFESLLGKMGPNALLCADNIGNQVLNHLIVRGSAALLKWVIDYASKPVGIGASQMTTSMRRALRKAMLTANDAMGQTALFMVPDVATLKVLEQAGAWALDARNMLGQTALHVMQRRQEAAIVNDLKKMGAKSSIPDPEMVTDGLKMLPKVEFEKEMQKKCAGKESCLTMGQEIFGAHRFLVGKVQDNMQRELKKKRKQKKTEEQPGESQKETEEL